MLQECIAKANIPDTGIILVTDCKGFYLARYPDSDKWVGTKSHSWEVMEAKGESRIGFVESTGADGIQRIYYNTLKRNFRR